MERRAMNNRYQRSNSEQLEINAELFIVIRKRNISIKEKLEKLQNLLTKNPQPDIDAQDGNDNWNTALHLAINKNELQLVNFLLTQGANTAIKNGDGKTPLDLAAERNHVQIIGALKRHISQAEWLCSGFTLGEALEGADGLFDGVAQGMSALCVRDGPFSVLCVRDRQFNVQSLRQSCCDYARDNQDGIYDSQTGTTWLQAIAENASTGGYATGSSFESYLAKLKEDSAIWGRPDIEGRMLCEIYGIKLHVLEKQTADGHDVIYPQLVDRSGLRVVRMDESTNLYKEHGVIHLLNEGQGHFVPLLPQTEVHNKPTEQRAHWPHSERERLAPQNFQPAEANPNKLSVCHSSSHAAATDKQAVTTVLPPFSGELKVDRELKLSDGDFKHRIDKFYENKQLSAINQLKATPAFPTPHVLAQFAKLAYTDYQREEPHPPDGWKLLTTASHFGAKNGYFGTAYWHPDHQQVVIAHRGTDPKNIGALVTDIKGVSFNNYVDQMSSASTFANKVVAVMQEIEQETGVSFELFFTGHSLGGWLAQITTFTTKYLEEMDGIFLKRHERVEHELPASSTAQDTHDVPHSYHPHTVVFDSPGCKDMLLQMTDKLDVRLHGRSIDLQHLDITSYLSAPNRVNTCNSHLGTVYRIFIDLSHMNSWRKRTLTYTPNTHSIDKIVEAFDPKTGQVRKDDNGELKIREVVDWPLSAGITCSREYNDFFKWAKPLNNYHPEVMDTVFSNVPEGYHQLRYQTKAYDECAKYLSNFTEEEREFLERYRWLCHVPEFFNPDDLFSVMNNTEAQKEAEQKLRKFELDNESVRCPDASTLQALIPYVKRLVRLFPHIKENIKDKLSSSQIRSRVYQYETQRYIETIQQSILDFIPGALGLEEFLTSDQQLWQLRMIDGDVWTGLAKVYRLFQKTDCTANCFSAGDCTVLKLKRLLKVNRMINFSALLASMKTPHLLMMAFETNQPVNDELRDMFKELFNILKQKRTIKIILTTPPEDSIAACLQQTATTTLGEGLRTTDVQLTWSDLTRSSQTKILEKAVIFQGRRVALNQLTSAESVTNYFPLADLLQEPEIRIGKEPIPSACSGYNEMFYINRTFHHKIVIRHDIESDNREGKFDLLAYDKEGFKQLCQQNPKSNVHWLFKDESGELMWQQSQGNLKTLRKYTDPQKFHSYGPKDLDKLLEQARFHRVMLIADKAGMGKSTLLTHLSEQIQETFPAHWLVRIDLNGYTEQLEAQKGKKMDKERVLEFVSKEVLKLESRLEKELFKKSFERNETNKVVIMFDGFDEISPSYKQTVIDMLQVLKQTSLEQLWITTRPHLREELEDYLQQIAYTLQPFTEVEQVEFLSKLWLQNSKLEATNQRRLESYATALISKLAQSISDKDKDFAGIPLQTRMLAEAFQEEFISFYRSQNSEPDLPHKLDLLGLYGRFIDIKYDVFFREKSKMPAGNVAAQVLRELCTKNIQLQHQLLALQALFTEDHVTRLQINHESISSDAEKLAMIGIVQINHDGKPQFIHRTFAEYYVADFLINRLTKRTKQHIQVQEFLLNIILLRKDCHVIRAFLDGLLEKSKPSNEALKEYGEILNQQWNEGEVLSRLIGLLHTALSRAATENNIHIIGFLLNSLKSGEHSNALRKMLLATDAEGRTAWHRAANKGNAEALQRIWECVDEVTPTVTCSLLLIKDTPDETASHLDTERDHINSSEKPWNSAKETQIYAEELKKQMLLAQDAGGKTAWHMAAESCNEEVLEKIWRWAKEVLMNPNELKENLVLVQSRHGETAWHLAAKECSTEILGKLWAWAKEAQLNHRELQNKLLLGRDRDGKTVLHMAIENSAAVLKELCAFAKETKVETHVLKDKLLLATDKDGNTAWQEAVSIGNLEVLEALWSWAKEAQLKPNELSELLLTKNKYGNTVWHAAAKGGNLEILEAIWSGAKEAEQKPNQLSELLLTKDKYGNTVWHAAAERGNLEVFQSLWSWAKEAELKPNELSESLLTKNKYGNTVSHAAAQGGNLEILEAIWSWAKEAEQKPNKLSELLLTKDKYGNTVWHAAAERGNLEVFQSLWSWAKEAELKPKELSESLLIKNKYGNTVWNAAAKGGNLEIVEALWSWAKEAELKPNELRELLIAKIEDGNTVWLEEAKDENLEILEAYWSWFKEAELKPNELSELLLTKDKYGNTMWHAAAESGNLELFQSLCSWAKEAELKPNELIELLLTTNKYGNTVWNAAAKGGNLEIVEALWSWAKEAELKPNELSELLLTKHQYGYTVWHAAAKGGNLEIVEALWSWAKEAELKPNELSELLLTKDKYGNTVWHAAVEGGNLEILEALRSWAKEAELKPNELSELLLTKHQYGYTVWHAAVEGGNLEILEALRGWAKEAELKTNELSELLLTKDDYGNTVWHTAAKEDNLEILEALWRWAKEELKPNELSELLQAKDDHGRTVWHTAEGNLEIVEALWSWAKEAELKPNELIELLLAKDEVGNTMWHAAAEGGNLELVEALWSWAKEAQLKPNELIELLLAKDGCGITVWHVAVESDNLRLFESLRSWAKEAELKPKEFT